MRPRQDDDGLSLMGGDGFQRHVGSIPNATDRKPRWIDNAKCNPVDSIGSSTKSRVSHSERRPSARFPGDKDGSARRKIEPVQ